MACYFAKAPHKKARLSCDEKKPKFREEEPLMGKHNTPMLDELEKGPWPSFVSDIKQQAEKGKHVLKEAPDDLLGVLELSYEDKVTHWKHGGIVGVFGYGGGDHWKILRPASEISRVWLISTLSA